MDRYEHMGLDLIQPRDAVRELNKHGAEGWKIVAWTYSSGWHFILGRKVPEPDATEER